MVSSRHTGTLKHRIIGQRLTYNCRWPFPAGRSCSPSTKSVGAARRRLRQFRRSRHSKANIRRIAPYLPEPTTDVNKLAVLKSSTLEIRKAHDPHTEFAAAG